MKIDGHYDREADIAWLQFEGYDPTTVTAEETAAGLRESDPKTRQIVASEHWHGNTEYSLYDLMRRMAEEDE